MPRELRMNRENRIVKAMKELLLNFVLRGRREECRSK